MGDDRPPAGSDHSRYPGLDLLRALAIVLVVHCHAATVFGSRPEYRVLQLGGRGSICSSCSAAGSWAGN
jgi:peptidoglycan/LPS O-acetylase OafA/YrhL